MARLERGSAGSISVLSLAIASVAIALGTVRARLGRDPCCASQAPMSPARQPRAPSSRAARPASPKAGRVCKPPPPASQRRRRCQPQGAFSGRPQVATDCAKRTGEPLRRARRLAGNAVMERLERQPGRCGVPRVSQRGTGRADARHQLHRHRSDQRQRLRVLRGCLRHRRKCLVSVKPDLRHARQREPWRLEPWRLQPWRLQPRRLDRRLLRVQHRQRLQPGYAERAVAHDRSCRLGGGRGKHGADQGRQLPRRRQADGLRHRGQPDHLRGQRLRSGDRAQLQRRGQSRRRREPDDLGRERSLRDDPARLERRYDPGRQDQQLWPGWHLLLYGPATRPASTTRRAASSRATRSRRSVPRTRRRTI